MCRINFTIQHTDANGDGLQAAQGRYKFKNEVAFQDIFNINLSNPQTPDINVNGEYDLQVRVQDVRGLWSEWFISPEGFKVGNCTPNQKPTVFAGVDQNVASNSTTVTAIASDPDGTIVSYLWEVMSGGPSVTITSPNTATTEITGLIEGTHIFRCTVTDNDGLTAQDEVEIVYTPNVNENTLFKAVKIDAGRFKLETSRYINTATFILNYVTKVEDDRESQDGNATYEYFSQTIHLNGNFDLQNSSDKNTIINEIVSKPTVIGNATSWEVTSGIFNIEFNTIFGSSDNGMSYTVLNSVTNVSAT